MICSKASDCARYVFVERELAKNVSVPFILGSTYNDSAAATAYLESLCNPSYCTTTSYCSNEQTALLNGSYNPFDLSVYPSSGYGCCADGWLKPRRHVNVVMAPLMNRERFTWKDVIGVVLIVGGSSLTVLFAGVSEQDYNLCVLLALFRKTATIVFLTVTFGLIAAVFCVIVVVEKNQALPDNLRRCPSQKEGRRRCRRRRYRGDTLAAAASSSSTAAAAAAPPAADTPAATSTPAETPRVARRESVVRWAASLVPNFYAARTSTSSASAAATGAGSPLASPSLVPSPAVAASSSSPAGAQSPLLLPAAATDGADTYTPAPTVAATGRPSVSSLSPAAAADMLPVRAGGQHKGSAATLQSDTSTIYTADEATAGRTDVAAAASGAPAASLYDGPRRPRQSFVTAGGATSPTAPADAIELAPLASATDPAAPLAPPSGPATSAVAAAAIDGAPTKKEKRTLAQRLYAASPASVRAAADRWANTDVVPYLARKIPLTSAWVRVCLPFSYVALDEARDNSVLTIPCLYASTAPRAITAAAAIVHHRDARRAPVPGV
ncbi:hypothetical protein HK405_005247, partial [Cladochytrium tenue]